MLIMTAGNMVEIQDSLLTTLMHIVTLFTQGQASINAAGRVPEDYERLGLPRPLAVSQEALDREARWKKIVANDLEAIPMGLIVMWAAAGSASSPATETIVLVCAVLFTIARFAFTYAYMHALQPWRTLAWALGTASIVVAGTVGTVGAWTGQKL